MMVDYAELGKRIAKRRRILNLTQDKLAEATGLSNNHISNIENNHSIPSIETLIKICAVLQVTPDYFLLGILRMPESNHLLNIQEKIRLCGERQLRLIDDFITWIIDESL